MKLPAQVTFRNMDENGLEEYARQQAAKLERYYSGITSCRVMVEARGRHKHGNTVHVRIDLGLPDGELLVKHEPQVHATLRAQEAPRVTKSAEPERAHKNARKAILDAFAEMRRRLQEYVRVRRGRVKKHEEPQLAAHVASLFPEENYGFLTTADGRQVYFHQDSVLNGHFGRLRAGSAVQFVEQKGEKGAQASTVRLIHPRQQAKRAAGVAVVRRTLRAR